ncbi:MAG: biotin/lipoyl-containing protein [Actinomycetota bacterium]
MSVFAKGILATIVVPAVLFGMVYLLLSMILGAKLAYWVEASVTFGVLSIMSFIWTVSALGPTGAATVWQTISVGPSITSAKFRGETYNLADYPNSSRWETPTAGKYLADLNGADDLAAEETLCQTAMDGSVADHLSTVVDQVKTVKPIIHGNIQLTTGNYTEDDIKMTLATVGGRSSILAVGRGVPSKPISVNSLPGQSGTGQTATIVKYLVEPGDTVTANQNVMQISNNGSTNVLTTSQGGIVAALGPAAGSLVRPGVPILTLDLSGQAGEPPPVLIAAVRVRGDLHTPAAIYLLCALLLFVVHLSGLSKLEKKRKALAPVERPV